jgi:hypothetical protein
MALGCTSVPGPEEPVLKGKVVTEGGLLWFLIATPPTLPTTASATAVRPAMIV